MNDKKRIMGDDWPHWAIMGRKIFCNGHLVSEMDEEEYRSLVDTMSRWFGPDDEHEDDDDDD